MGVELQKASMWKRISAWLLDIILLSVIVVGIGALLSLATGYDGHTQDLEDAYARYETQYAVTFDISAEAFAAMTPEEQQNYNAAYDALIADEDVLYVYNLVLNLTLVITTLAILLGYLIMEFVLPLILGNGQTVGKKIFAIGLVRNDGVKMNTMQLFVRTMLGKFTIETMIPVYILIMLYFNMVGLGGTLFLGALLLAQIILLAVTRNRTPIHDLLAGTAAVDISSQQIFRSTEELIAYTKRLHAERAARKPY